MKCSICGKKIHKHEPHKQIEFKHKVRTKLGERVVTDFVKVCYRCKEKVAEYEQQTKRQQR